MEYKVEAHRIMSISLGKIYNSRVQRGGIKLHKNLLVSLVLRSARQVYLSDYYGGVCLNAQQMEGREWGEREIMDSEQDKLVPEATDNSSPDNRQDGFALPTEEVAAEMADTAAQPQVEVTSPAGEQSSPAEITSKSDCSYQTTQEVDTDSVSASVDSRTGEVSVSCPVPAQCVNTGLSPNTKTTVEESPGECERLSASGRTVAAEECDSQEPKSHLPTAPVSCCTRKRSAEKSPRTTSPIKKTKLTASTTPVSPASSEDEGAEEMDTSNVSSLITIFGSSFSGLLSKDGAQAEPESEDSDSGAGQICCEQMLKNLNPWSTAIVAF
ncbi:immediate early response gene 5 protein [Conger conger]|uniref:immediate early response gene 5 protein n=1 Tax=Conger conger TaxID=82655 RepID=UPI002A5A28FA|nr:immediate early response gene 5 protein [Conger conger]